MREDMYKVIVERPRLGGNLPISRTAYIKGDAEDLVKQESMRKRWAYDRKSLNENLNPLKRFFDSKIGQHYDDVWSELCEYLNDNSTVKKHVKDHAKDMVELNVRMIDGKPYTIYKYTRSGWEPLVSTKKVKELYKDPNTGLIQVAPYKVSRSRKKVAYTTRSGPYGTSYVKRPEIKIPADNGAYERYNGIWYYVYIEYKPSTSWRLISTKSITYGMEAYEVINGRKVYDRTKVELVTTYTENLVFHQIGKRVIKKLKNWIQTGQWDSKKKKQRRKVFRK